MTAPAKQKLSVFLVACRDGAVEPQRATSGSFGYDLSAHGDHVIEPGTTAIIPSGLKLANVLPPGIAMLVLPRSSLTLKTGLFVPNSPGLIDADYTGEIGVIVHNLTAANEVRIAHGTRIAQLVFPRIETPFVRIIGDEARAEDRIERGGFGSTGA